MVLSLPEYAYMSLDVRKFDVVAGQSPFSMLGLGDVVIPGIFVAMCLRYDVEHGSSYFHRSVLIG